MVVGSSTVDSKKMPPNRISEPSDHADQTWQEIDHLVDELARLSKSAASSAQFHAALVDLAVDALAAVGGAIWLRAADGRLESSYQRDLDCRSDDHRRLAEAAWQTGEPALIPPNSGPAALAADQAAGNRTGNLLIFAPIQDDDRCRGVLEVVQRCGSSPPAQRGYLRLLNLFCELAVEFHRHQELRSLREQAGLRDRLDRFIDQVHRGIDLDETVYRVVNEGRRLIGCDRVTVLVKQGRRCQVRAVSGVDVLDRRARAVKRLERLVGPVVEAAEPFWYRDGDPLSRPDLERQLADYLDESHARVLAVVPLVAADDDSPDRSQASLGALVVEDFTAETGSAMEPRVAAVAHHGAAAIRNARTYARVPLLWLWQALDRVGWLVRPRQLPLTLIAAFAAVAVGLTLALVQADFQIEAPGELQPLRRRDVFATTDGVVTELLARHGQMVAAGDKLAVLDQSRLDLEDRRLGGEIETARKRLAAVQASRLGDEPADREALRAYAQLTAEEEELKLRLANLDQQYRIVNRQRDELTVTSPIAGQVITWNLDQLLRSRPVQRGQVLMTVADLAGPWLLELHVADARIGHVLAAAADRQEPLRVHYLLAARPELTYHGTRRNRLRSARAADRAGDCRRRPRHAGPAGGQRPGQNRLRSPVAWLPLAA